MRPRCPKCQSPNTYQQDGENACMMCGSRFPVNGARIVVKKIFGESGTRDRESCSNCKRNICVVSYGLCGTCYVAVKGKGFPPGSPEWEAALAAIRERIADPKFGHYARKKKTINVVSA